VTNATAAEIIYGTGIRLAAEFFLPAKSQATSDFVKRIKERIDDVKPQPIARHGTRKVFVFRELETTPYVMTPSKANFDRLTMDHIR
jgi:hypothetical protein